MPRKSCEAGLGKEVRHGGLLQKAWGRDGGGGGAAQCGAAGAFWGRGGVWSAVFPRHPVTEPVVNVCTAREKILVQKTEMGVLGDEGFQEE